MSKFSVGLTMIPDLKENDVVRFTRAFPDKTFEIVLRVTGIEYLDSRKTGMAVKVSGEFVASTPIDDKEELEKIVYTHYKVLEPADYESLKAFKFGSNYLEGLLDLVHAVYLGSRREKD